MCESGTVTGTAANVILSPRPWSIRPTRALRSWSVEVTGSAGRSSTGGVVGLTFSPAKVSRPNNRGRTHGGAGTGNPSPGSLKKMPNRA